MNFADRLDQAVRRTESPLLVGIDPHLDLLPAEFEAARDPQATAAERARAVGRFAAELIELVAGRVAAVKPQSAFFEQLGAEGSIVWEETLAAARAADLLVVGDVKRGDIASTAAAYASAHLEGSGACDAITINPFLGRDSVQPVIETCEKTGAGAYVLVRTSNPGGADFQNHGDPPLYRRIAEAVHAWGEPLVGECGLSSLGAVVGATNPAELAELRTLLPRTPFLLPGYGAQGASAEDTLGGFLPGGRGALVASSRAISFAHRSPAHAGLPWKDAASRALDLALLELRTALASRA